MLRKTNKYLATICVSLLFVGISSNNLFAQNFNKYHDPELGISNKVYVQYSDSIVETFYYKGDKKIKTDDGLFYYWYAAHDIKKTRGAFEGKLLHGKYVMFYYNKDLLCKGEFKYGLKDGVWKSWHKGGEIKSKERWKKGRIMGIAYYYHPNGKLKSHRKYTNYLGRGHEANYDTNGNLISKKYYSRNELVKEVRYHQNDKDKTVVTKPEKAKKTKKEKDKKKVKEGTNSEPNKKTKKGKQPKVKIQKFRQISPGGIGA